VFQHLSATVLYLLCNPQVEEDDDFSQLVNPKTKFETVAVGDVNMTSLKQGDIIQLERKGYYITDQAYGGPDKPVVLFNIPDGRNKNMALLAEQ
jgi:glutamyl-tRNA synthetase